MRKILAMCAMALLAGCQKDVTIVPAPQPAPQQQRPNRQPNMIVVPGRPACPPPKPGVHIQTPGVDINVNGNYRWCNRCGVWVHADAKHDCR